MAQSSDEHLSPAEFHGLVEDLSLEIPRHLDECELCRTEREAFRRAEALIRQALIGEALIGDAARQSPLPEQNCPPAETWLDLTRLNLAGHLDHAAVCDICAARLGNAVAGYDESLSAEEAQLVASLQSSGSEWQREMASGMAACMARKRPGPWLASAAAVLLAAGLWAIFRPASPDVLLAQAYTESRPMEFRLPDRGYRQVNQKKESAAEGFASLPPSLRKALPAIDDGLAAHKDDPELLRLQAEAELLQPQAGVDLPLATLERLHRQNPGDSVIWLPLACAYFRRAESDPDNAAVDYARALELIESLAQKSPHDPPALFDAALIRTRLHDESGAISAWERYLQVDGQSGYADEARRYLGELKQRKRQRDRALNLTKEGPERFLAASENLPAELFLDAALSEWLPRAEASPAAREAAQRVGGLLREQSGDPFLQEMALSPLPPKAVEALGQAILLDRSANPEEGTRQAKRAAEAFRRAGNSAGRLRARVEAVYGLHRSMNAKDCLAEAVALDRDAARYPWISTQNRIEKSICLAIGGDLAESMKTAESAEKQAAAAHLASLELRARDMLTNYVLLIGNVNAVWRRAPDGLARYWSIPMAPNQAHQMYGDLSEAATRLNLPHVSYDFRREAVDAISQTDEALLQASGHNALSVGARAAGLAAEADREKAASLRLFDRLPDTRLKEEYRMDADLTRAAQEANEGRPAAAIPILLRLQSVPGPTALSRVLEALASAQFQAGDFEGARHTAQEAVVRNRETIASLQSPSDRISTAAREARAYRTLAEIRLSKDNDPRGAFATLQLLSEPSDANGTVAAWSKSLGSDIFLSLSDLPGGPVVWMLDSSGLRFRRLGGKAGAIAEQADALLRQCADSLSSAAEIGALAEALRKELLGSFADASFSAIHGDRVLIVAADAPFARVPFGVVFGPSPRALVRSAGLPEYLQRIGPEPGITKRSQLLLADSPAVPGELGRLYPALRDSAREADDVAAQFTRVTRLQGTSATVSAVNSALPSADVFHFSGHGSASGGNGALVLSPEDAAHPFSAFLTAGQIGRQSGLRCQLAVLSACGTATGEAEGPVNPDSLVRALLQSGVRRVVASQWSVPAASTRAFMAAFYRRLGEGAEPARALQLAETELRGDASTAHPFYWAAFQIFGYR